MTMYVINLIQRDNGSGPYWIAYHHPCVNFAPIKDEHDVVIDYVIDGCRMGSTRYINENGDMTVRWTNTCGAWLMFAEEKACDAMWLRIKDHCIGRKELHKICGG